MPCFARSPTLIRRQHSIADCVPHDAPASLRCRKEPAGITTQHSTPTARSRSQHELFAWGALADDSAAAGAQHAYRTLVKPEKDEGVPDDARRSRTSLDGRAVVSSEASLPRFAPSVSYQREGDDGLICAQADALSFRAQLSRCDRGDEMPRCHAQQPPRPLACRAAAASADTAAHGQMPGGRCRLFAADAPPFIIFRLTSPSLPFDFLSFDVADFRA